VSIKFFLVKYYEKQKFVWQTIQAHDGTKLDANLNLIRDDFVILKVFLFGFRNPMPCDKLID